MLPSSGAGQGSPPRLSQAQQLQWLQQLQRQVLPHEFQQERRPPPRRGPMSHNQLPTRQTQPTTPWQQNHALPLPEKSYHLPHQQQQNKQPYQQPYQHSHQQPYQGPRQQRLPGQLNPDHQQQQDEQQQQQQVGQLQKAEKTEKEPTVEQYQERHLSKWQRRRQKQQQQGQQGQQRQHKHENEKVNPQKDLRVQQHRQRKLEASRARGPNSDIATERMPMSIAHHRDGGRVGRAGIHRKGCPSRRAWDRLVDDSQDTFTVMTYNLLADSLVRSNMHLYAGCDRTVLSWNNRGTTLLAELEKLESHTLDFYCFQELDEHHYQHDFQEAFKSWGYTGFYKKRNGDKTDGCALFFRNDSVSPVLLRSVDYNENTFIPRDNIGIVGLFDVKQGSEKKRICIATTHILFNPRNGMFKLAQVRMLLEKAKEMIEQQDMDIPIVMCGDMNALPQSPVVDYLISEGINVSLWPENFLSGQTPGLARRGYYENNIQGFHAAFGDSAGAAPTQEGRSLLQEASVVEQQAVRLSSFDPSRSAKIAYTARTSYHPVDNHAAVNMNPHITQPFVLQSAYDISTPSRKPNGAIWAGPREPFTTYHRAARQVCDYIFYGQLRAATPKPSKLQLVACLELACELAKMERGLPSRDFGSDHLSLVSKFRFV